MLGWMIRSANARGAIRVANAGSSGARASALVGEGSLRCIGG